MSERRTIDKAQGNKSVAASLRPPPRSPRGANDPGLPPLRFITAQRPLKQMRRKKEKLFFFLFFFFLPDDDYDDANPITQIVTHAKKGAAALVLCDVMMPSSSCSFNG